MSTAVPEQITATRGQRLSLASNEPSSTVEPFETMSEPVASLSRPAVNLLVRCQVCEIGSLSIIPVADQLALVVIQRAIVFAAVVPDEAGWPVEGGRLTKRQRSADRVVLVAGDAAHLPAGQLARIAGRAIPERHRLGLLVDVHNAHRVVGCGVGVRVGLAVIIAWRW